MTREEYIKVQTDIMDALFVKRCNPTPTQRAKERETNERIASKIADERPQDVASLTETELRGRWV